MKLFRKIAAAGLSALLAGSLLAGCGSTADMAKIDGTKTVMTINEDTVSLGTLSFLAKYQQAQMYALYNMYFGTTEIFDTVMDESTGKTYGETIKGYAVDDVQEMVLLRQHAEEYGISLTAEEEAEIEKAAQAFIDENTDEVREMIGASKENVIEIMELQLLKSKMLDPLVADVDTEVSDEEAQQSGVTYVQFQKTTEEDIKNETEDESSLADSGVAADTDIAAQVDAANVETLRQAEELIAAIQATGDVANADITSIASGINSELHAQTGQFTTHNTEDTVLDMAIVEACEGLTDGTLVDHVVEAKDGLSWFVVRFDAAYDEAATQDIKDEKVKARKQEAYDKLIADWKDASEITVDEAVLATLILSDSNPITLGQDPLPDESTAESGVADEYGLAAESSVAAESVGAEAQDSTVAEGEEAAEADADEGADASVAPAESTANE